MEIDEETREVRMCPRDGFECFDWALPLVFMFVYICHKVQNSRHVCIKYKIEMLIKNIDFYYMIL